MILYELPEEVILELAINDRLVEWDIDNVLLFVEVIPTNHFEEFIYWDGKYFARVIEIVTTTNPGILKSFVVTAGQCYTDIASKRFTDIMEYSVKPPKVRIYIDYLGSIVKFAD